MVRYPPWWGGKETMSASKEYKGFTIIEVVLVLAIAGLIFLIVFLALPALQRQQRDTQRRTDASRVSALVSNWQSNHSGRLPVVNPDDSNTADLVSFASTYLKNDNTPIDGTGTTGELRSPSTSNEYGLRGNTAAGEAVPAMTATSEYMYISTGLKCNGEVTVAATGKYAVQVLLENGGTYCVGSN